MGTEWMRIVYEWVENVVVSMSESKTVTMIMNRSVAATN